MTAGKMQEGRAYRSATLDVGILVEVRRKPNVLQLKWFWPDNGMFTESDWMSPGSFTWFEEL